MIRKKIVETAYKYEGQKEIGKNTGFENAIFEQKMQAVGFDSGESWCSLFAELVWCEAYGQLDSTIIYKLQKLFSESATKTWLNFKHSKDFKIKSKQDAQPGDLAIWQKVNKGVKDWRGHVGVVTRVAQLFFLSMEGNTNEEGSREGQGVYEKKREFDFYNNNGLRLLGFVKPKEV
jgi:hypothetical protein